MTGLQMIMGTQVREAVDIIARVEQSRSLWIDQLPLILKVHRSFSSVILFINIWLVWQVLKHIERSHPMRRVAIAQGLLIVSTIVIGAIMYHFSIPSFFQPFHLWLASLIFGVQITLFLFLRYGMQYGTGSHENPATHAVAARA